MKPLAGGDYVVVDETDFIRCVLVQFGTAFQYPHLLGDKITQFPAVVSFKTNARNNHQSEFSWMTVDQYREGLQLLMQQLQGF